MNKVISTLLIIPTLSFAASGLQTHKQKLSYAFGADLGQYLKQKNVPLDLKALNQGIMDVLQTKKLQLSEKQIRQAFETFKKHQQDADKKVALTNLEAGKKYLEKMAKKANITKLPNGILYEVIKKGNSKKHPKPTDTVTAHYEGTLIDGTVFDSSYKRGKPADFPLNRVIKGWTQTLPLMSVGDTWKIYIPSHLAYGTKAQGPIKGNSTLIFKVNLLKVH